MEITLEKIELVKDRTGVSYKEAKEALEGADGSVVDAIITIEEAMDEKASKKFGQQGADIADKIKELVNKGNVAKIQVKKDGELVLNIPLNVGILGIVIAPVATVLAVAASFGFKCDIEVIKTDGTVVDVSDRAKETKDIAVEKGSAIFEDVKTKGGEYFEKAKEKVGDTNLDEIKDKAKNLAGQAKEKVGEVDLDDIKEKAKDLAEQAKDKIKTKDDDLALNITEDLEDAAEVIEEGVNEELDKATEE